MLPGMVPVVAGGLQLTHVGDASSNASTIVIPAGAAIGDLAILIDCARNGTTTVPAEVTPTDWTQIFTNPTDAGGGARQRTTVSYKLLVSGDPGATITGQNAASGTNNKGMTVYRPSKPILTVTPSMWNFETTAGDPALQTVSAAGVAIPLVIFAMAFASNGTGAFSTASPAFDATFTPANGDPLFGRKLYNGSPADHSIDMGDISPDGSNANILTSGFVRVA